KTAAQRMLPESILPSTLRTPCERAQQTLVGRDALADNVADAFVASSLDSRAPGSARARGLCRPWRTGAADRHRFCRGARCVSRRRRDAARADRTAPQGPSPRGVRGVLAPATQAR